MTMRARTSGSDYTIPINSYIEIDDWEQIQDWKEDFVTSTSDIVRKCIKIGLKHKNELFKILNDDQKEREKRYGA